MLVYDLTQEQSFANVSKWLRNIEEVDISSQSKACFPVCSCISRML